MRPKRIIPVRHGQSEGNFNGSIYQVKPYFALNLTSEGRQQARSCGDRLRTLLGNESVMFYRSPFYRTRQTHEEITTKFPDTKFYEDPRLREQERTLRVPGDRDESVEKERDEYGHFYYRFNGGESCADVYDRVSDFLSTMYRDFEKNNFPQNCVIISHGMTNRVFLMRLLHYTVEEFEFLSNPKNCGFYVLELQDNGKYKLSEEPARYEKRNCRY